MWTKCSLHSRRYIMAVNYMLPWLQEVSNGDDVLCSVQCVLWTVHCTLFRLQWKLCTVYCSGCSTNCALYTVPVEAKAVHCILFRLQYKLCTVYCSGCNENCALCASLLSVDSWALVVISGVFQSDLDVYQSPFFGNQTQRYWLGLNLFNLFQIPYSQILK